jgi:hypothetical protein
MHPKIKISRFDPFKNKQGAFVPGVVPHPDDLYTQLERFRDGYYADLIHKLRELTDKDEISSFKTANLPAFTFSVSIKNTRKTDNIEGHTGVLTIDIDEDGIAPYLRKRQEKSPSYTLGDFRDEIAIIDESVESSSVLFAGLSASGKGLFILFKIDPGQHEEAFEAIKWEFQSYYGIAIDKACRDQVRLRFCTYDKDAIINDYERVVKYEIPQEYLNYKQQKEDAAKANKNLDNTFASESAAVEKILAQATRGIHNSVPGERHTVLLRASRLLGGYVASGALDAGDARDTLIGAANEINWDEPMEDIERTVEDGLRYGQEHPIEVEIIPPGSPEYEKYVELSEEQQEKRKNFYRAIHLANRKGIPLKELDIDELCENSDINLADGKKIAERIYKEHKEEFGFNKKAIPLQVRTVMNKHWEIRRNVITDELQWRERNKKKWEKVNIEQVWYTVCEKLNKPISIASTIAPAITLLAKEYDPFREKFRELCNKYDGETDHIANLAQYVTLEPLPDETSDEYDERHKYFTDMLKKMLVRAVKCATIPQYVNRYVFVFASQTQSIGKSQFFRWLNPFPNSEYYTESDLQNNKDSTFAMAETLIYNLEELSVVNKRDVNDLKKQISMGNTRERKAYGRNRESVIRRCSFFGSTNRLDFLVDDSNSRWLIFEVKDIDWKGYVTDCSVDEIWGQAAYLALQQDYDCELDIQEVEKRDISNLDFLQLNDEDEFVKRHYAVCGVDDPRGKFVTPACLLDAWRILYPGTNLSNGQMGQRVGRALTRGGYVRLRKRLMGQKTQTRGYIVAPINQDPGVTKSAHEYENRTDFEGTNGTLDF